MALYHKQPGSKATWHYDTTIRSSINGDWPSLILMITKCGQHSEFRLRPIYFAFENRDQIIDLFVESLTRLSVIVSISEGKNITPSSMWEKVDAVMTDAVSKNLEIENNFPQKIGSEHHPYHLLCKSHTVEALDRSNLKVLSMIEKKVNQRAIFENINPGLKSFFRGKTALVEAGIESILNLVTHDKSAKSCSKADLFDHICEREEVVKRMFLYQQRRFAKVGKAAALSSMQKLFY